MAKVIISRFDGGHAEDIRTTHTAECAESCNFDLYTSPHKLLPIRNSVAETSSPSIDDVEMSDVGTTVVSGTTYLAAVGQESSVSNIVAFYTRDSGMNGVWSQQAVGAAGHTYVKGTLAMFEEKAFAVGVNGTQYKLQRFDGASTVTTVGTFSVPTSISVVPRPFVHPQDKILYFVVGNVISKWDGTTFTTYTDILPTGFTATSITDYGTYLAIAMRPIEGGGNTVCYLWGRDGSLTTLQGIIDFGEGELRVIENINNELVGLVYPTNISTFSSVYQNKVDIKVYSGGSVSTVKSVDLGSQSNYNYLKLKKDGKLYFAVAGTETCLWAVYKNKSGYWTVNKERYLYNGSTTAADTIQSVIGLNAVGDFFYIATFDQVGTARLMATDDSANFSNGAVYKTTINPGMPVSDRNAEKILKAVKVFYTGKASGTITVKYLIDGKNSSDTTTFETILSESTSAEESYVNASQLADGNAFGSGVEFQFQIESDNGVEIKSLEYEYDKLNS